jgi:3-oxoacyl-[acyl-carrier protein] reductase
MDLGLTGKVAWVLGATSGMGRATAAALAAEGASVAVSARREDELAATAKDIENQVGTRCLAVPLDVSDGPGIAEAGRRIAGELGPVGILFSNAGGPPPGGFDEFDDAALYDAFTLTTASAWRLAKAVVPGMKEQRSGCLIFNTSWSVKEVIPNLLLSNMLRASVVSMAKTLSKELGPHGIRVLVAAPGRIDTPRMAAIDQNTARTLGKPIEEVERASMAEIPLGRYGTPEEFGQAMTWLASDRASYMTGITVTVDGGLLNMVQA